MTPRAVRLQTPTPAQPDRVSSASWWNGMWDGARVRYVERPEDARVQWELYEARKFEYLRQLFPRGHGTRSLECGCGSAGVSLHFAMRGYDAVMLDFAPNALALARRNFRSEGVAGRFVCADVGSTPFRDGTYDVVMSYGLIEHFVDVRVIVREMVRLLRPGGMLFLDIVPRRFNVQTIANLTFNWYAALAFGVLVGRPREGWRRAKELFAPPFFENRYRMEQYQAWMEEAGLGDVRISGNNPFPRLYLPGPLDRLFIKVLTLLLPVWRRFDARPDGWFKRHWARAWWARGIKPA